ncbi:DEAD/DEAH box helicase, partial [Methanocaldococcus sp.]
IFPTRALIYNQYEKFKYILNRFYGEKPRIEILTGDTPYNKRKKILEEKPEILISTPDMLHYQLLKYNYRYKWLFDNLKYLVVDEIHEYNGVFGANVSYVFKRLFNLANPQIIGLSATLSNPKEFTKKLFNKEFKIIDKSYNPQPKKYFVVLHSEDVSEKDLLGKFLSRLIDRKIKSLVFFDSRRKTEELLNYLKLRGVGRVTTYKGTFTPKDRREVEEKFKRGEYLALLTTNALELGIDIGDVDAVINYGIPSTGIFSLIQRFGRAGRRDKEAINAIVLRKDGLDYYYKENVDELSEKVVNGVIEEIPITVENRIIAKKHILYMINELKKVKLDKFNDFEKEIVRELILEGKVKLIRLKDGSYLIPMGDVKYSSLRNIRDDSYYLISDILIENEIKKLESEREILNYIDKLKESNKLVEILPIDEFYSSLLPGMVYYSRGRGYLVTKIIDKGIYHFILSLPINIYVKCKIIGDEEVSILKTYEEKEFKNIKIFRGRLKITNEISGFVVEGEIEKYELLLKKLFNNLKYEKFRDKLIVKFPSSISYTFETEGIWLIFPSIIKNIPNKEFEHFFSLLDDEYKEITIDLLTKINRKLLFIKFLGGTSHYIRKIIEKEIKKRGLKVTDDIVYKIFKVIESKDGVIGGLHAIEHLFINLSPIFAYVNNKELGGRSYSSYPKAPNIGKSIIFIYDANEGGSGLSEPLYNKAEIILRKVYKHLNLCSCLYGCPKCVLSTKCGNFNEFLDKWQAKEILKICIEGER